MYKFGKRSLDNLSTCQPDLVLIANELIKEMDCAVICGARGKEEQNQAFATGRSKLKYPKSKHNVGPEAGRKKSAAMDIVPSPIDWNDIARFNDMCNRIDKIAKRLNIKIRLGRDFSFRDFPHVELVNERE